VSGDARTVFVTGASAGIGAACARRFAADGWRVLVCARRAERVEALVAELQAGGAEAHGFALDVRDPRAVESAYEALPSNWRRIDVLVNNAGLSRGKDPLQEGVLSDWHEMIDTNVKGLLHVTRTVLPGMVERGSGQVVNIGSLAGHEVYPGGNVYCATKHAVDAITRGMRLDLVGSGVKVSTVDPGLADTEFSTVRYHGDRAKADATYTGMTPLTAEDVAETVRWVVDRPAHVNAAQVLLLPTDQASSVDVHRTDAR